MDERSLFGAVTEAFAYVACSDADLADAERERFIAWAGEQSAIEADPAALAIAFDEASGRFRADFAAAEQQLLAQLATFREQTTERELILWAAQVAVVADEKLEPVEEAALARVCEALGMDPADV